MNFGNKILDGQRVVHRLSRLIDKNLALLSPSKPLQVNVLLPTFKNGKAMKASAIYVKKKQEFFNDKNMNLIVERKCVADGERGLEILRDWIGEQNASSECDGVFVQLPLAGRSFDRHSVEQVWDVLDSIDVELDVDGLTRHSRAQVGTHASRVLPAAVHAVAALMLEHDVEWRGKAVTIIGQSRLVARPLEALLRGTSPFNTLARVERFDDMASDGAAASVRNADICVSAVGRAHSIRAEHIKANATLIDIGTSTDRHNNTLHGDFAPDCYDKCARYTPVPGGVGPVTVASLALNTVQLARARHHKRGNSTDINASLIEF